MSQVNLSLKLNKESIVKGLMGTIFRAIAGYILLIIDFSSLLNFSPLLAEAKKKNQGYRKNYPMFYIEPKSASKFL